MIDAPGSSPYAGDPLAVGTQQRTLPPGGRRPAGVARHDCAFARQLLQRHPGRRRSGRSLPVRVSGDAPGQLLQASPVSGGAVSGR
ncbi:hypothetical protein, partial [Streptomyces mirabilis]|uniref:hypothetical protein n=1 Tax=Streptomyces mirabilis TaxID=68239 RepID=UPI00381433C3